MSSAWQAHEFHRAGIEFKVQYPLHVEYKGKRLDCGYRIDMLINEELILELKSVEEVKGIHEAQFLTYMKLSGIKTGLQINFNAKTSDWC
jgi:GxxExxY protein